MGTVQGIEPQMEVELVCPAHSSFEPFRPDMPDTTELTRGSSSTFDPLQLVPVGPRCCCGSAATVSTLPRSSSP
eukprot:354866-Chlamydomonas_euryale.AAC.3